MLWSTALELTEGSCRARAVNIRQDLIGPCELEFWLEEGAGQRFESVCVFSCLLPLFPLKEDGELTAHVHVSVSRMSHTVDPEHFMWKKCHLQ